MDQAEKVRENRLRRMAERQGLRLSRSRRRDPRALDYGEYTLYFEDPDGFARRHATPNPARATLMQAIEMGLLSGLSLDEVERLLTGEEEPNA